MKIKLNKDEIIKVIQEKYHYDSETGSVFNKKTKKFVVCGNHKNIMLRKNEKHKAITIGILAHIFMTGEFPKHNVFLLDKSLGHVWNNLSNLPPLIRRVRERDLPKGVSLISHNNIHPTTKNIYQVTIFLDKLYALGRFSNIEDAELAYNICMKENKVIKFVGRFKNADLNQYRNFA